MTNSVLIVEDDYLQGENLAVLASSRGHVVSAVASTGEAAIAIAKATPPDVLIMDGRLAGEIDGLKAAERIAAERTCGIVLVTAYSDIAADARVERLRPVAVVRKPATDDEIIDAIDVAARHANGDPQPQACPARTSRRAA